jgi:GT2 family glycosyltransferase
LLGAGDASALQAAARAGGLADLTYEFFNANLGSSGGSNRLAAGAAQSFILVLNPDTYPAPNLLAELLSAFLDPSTGACDARQIPLEHPKDYDAATGDTSWVSGSCLLVRADVFAAVGGFDDEHFLLYCDDVDFSWRVRLKGFRTVHVPGAVVFHDKRIDPRGRVAPTPLEAYHGALARLMLARRYGRPDLVEATIAGLERDGSHSQRAALEEWRRREARGAVPDPIPDADRVAQFVGSEYARHRF